MAASLFETEPRARWGVPFSGRYGAWGFAVLALLPLDAVLLYPSQQLNNLTCRFWTLLTYGASHKGNMEPSPGLRYTDTAQRVLHISQNKPCEYMGLPDVEAGGQLKLVLPRTHQFAW